MKIDTIDLPDIWNRAPCGQLKGGNRVDYGWVFNPLSGSALGRNLVPVNGCYQNCDHYTNLILVSEYIPPKILAAMNQEVGGLPTAIIIKKKTAILAEVFGI